MKMDNSFFKGMTWGWKAERGHYRTEQAVDSMRKLRETGSEWIALSFWTWQENIHSTHIAYDYGYTVTDRDIAFAVERAKELGLKVCLKPVVNSGDGIWRAHIGFPLEDGASMYWDKWFQSYTNFILHYAELAEELGCEMLCIGCEMIKTESQSNRWRELIERIRQVYSGPLIYNANHGKEEGVEWFDDLDFIGTSAYYPVGEQPGDTEEKMIANWLPIRDRLARLHQKFNKPIVFMEIGCRSALGCAMMPWDFSHEELPFNEEEQANFYSSVMTVFWNEPWFAGFFWWDWSHRLYEEQDADKDTGFDIYGKKAERIVRQWYALEKATAI